jgi:DNA-binding GntR family transcriptional regulator
MRARRREYALYTVYAMTYSLKRGIAKRARRTSPVRGPRLLRDLVYDRIKEWIITGAFVPGEFLGEASLADRLGVSRTPVRETLGHLERDGLVQIVPHRGAFIRWPSPNDVEERFDIRIAIETLALRRAFPRLTEEVLRDLLQRVRAQRDRIDQASYQEIEQLSIQVHMAVLEAAGNRRIIDLTHQLREQVYIASTLYRNPDGTVSLPRVHQVADDHEAIITALLDRDLERAASELEAHLVRTKDMVIAAVQDAQLRTTTLGAAPVTAVRPTR